MTTPVVAVDLFCGVGGLTRGLELAGIDVTAGLDVDPDCELPYTRNNNGRFFVRDVDSLGGDELSSLFGEGTHRRLLAGCAPCQPFSTYSRSARASKKAVRGDWRLVAKFADLVGEVRPEYVTMENVPSLADHKVFEEFLSALDDYHVAYGVVQCVDFGVPQTRSRLVVIASLEAAISLPERRRVGPATVRSAIGGMPKLGAGQVDADDPIHRSSRLSAVNMDRIRASKPGGTWRDWPRELRAECHRRATGDTYPSVYGRMEWDKPSPTITTQCFGYGNGRFGHPEQDRAISLREAALLQTFPRGYKFVGSDDPVRFNKLGRLIGNAVPVKLAKHVGEVIVDHSLQLDIG